jgi:UDP-N-acetylmuramate dehydrogenase
MNTSLIQQQNILSPMLIQQNIPLADKNWFKTGGPARYYCQPTNESEFQQALQFAKQNSLEIFMLGKGANILISDDGFNGLVIHPKLQSISHVIQDNNTARVTAGAGTDFDDLIEYCLTQNLTNLEEFSGIPSTVGGAVYINLHYYEFFLADFLTEATVIHKDNGSIMTVQPEWFGFGYDISKLHNKNFYLVSATFKTKIVTDLEIAHARGRKQEIIRHRVRRFPTINTCGSFFRNFLPEEVVNTDKKLIFVAYYLDKVGIKGELCVGGAIVSHQHANMLINRGNATSSDIINLARLMQEKVQAEFTIIPQAECQLIGFKNKPLL